MRCVVAEELQVADWIMEVKLFIEFSISSGYFNSILRSILGTICYFPEFFPTNFAVYSGRVF